MNNRKAKVFAGIVPDVHSNFHINERVMHYAHVLLNFQNPASPICPINHGYQILNGLCMPIMPSKSPLPDELVKRVNHIIHRQIIQTMTKMMIIILVMTMNLIMNCLSESNCTKNLLTVSLFKMKNIFYDTYLNFVLKLEAKQNFLF